MPKSKPDPYDTQAYGPVPGAGPMVQGKIAILAIVLLGVAASIGSCVYYARLQQRPLALWGSEPARLMLRAPKAVQYTVEPVGEQGVNQPADAQASDAPVVYLQGKAWRLIDEREVTRAAGFSHIRQSFVHDASFDWDAAQGDCQPDWTHALRFVEGERTATILFAFNCGRAALASEVATATEATKTGDSNAAQPPARSASIRPVAGAIEQFMVGKITRPPPAEPKGDAAEAAKKSTD